MVRPSETVALRRNFVVSQSLLADPDIKTLLARVKCWAPALKELRYLPSHSAERVSP